jgi:putative FmdB family regulatory protein
MGQQVRLLVPNRRKQNRQKLESRKETGYTVVRRKDMPIYEYHCPECDAKFEELRPLNQADQPIECPQCHHTARRKMSTFACFTAGPGGVPKTIAGTGGSCSGCSSGSCNTCAS